MASLTSRLQRGHWYGWIFWGVAASFFLYEFFLRVMPSVIMKDLGAEFDASPVELSAALATYLWVYSPLQLVVGGLFDRFGAKFLIAGAALICGGGGFVFGMASDLHGVAFAEAMIGIGSAFAFVGALYVATVWFPPSRLALIAGITTAVGILGQIIGQTPLEEAVKAFDWRTIVLASGWIGIGLAVLLFVVIPPRPSWFHERFSEEEHVEYSILRGILHVLGIWKVWVVGIISATLFLPLSVVAAMWGNTFMETAGGFTAEEASFATIMLALGWLIGCPFAGIVSDLFGSRKWPLLIGSVGGGTTMLLFLWPSMFGYYGLLALMLIGGLFTSTQVICFAVVMELAPKVLRGTAAACNNFITMIIAAGLQVAVGWILTEEMVRPGLHPAGKHSGKVADLIKNATPEEFRLAMAVIPLLFIVAFVLCLILPETAPGKDRLTHAPSGH
jgi:MFS family permease